MKFFFKAKDGGELSKVWGYWLCEGKKSFSVALLRFENGSREAYHSHAFNSISLVLGPGHLEEKHLGDGRPEYHYFSDVVRTYRGTFHKVTSHGRTWVLTFRGPWSDKWQEMVTNNVYTLTHGRRRVGQETN